MALGGGNTSGNISPASAARDLNPGLRIDSIPQERVASLFRVALTSTREGVVEDEAYLRTEWQEIVMNDMKMPPKGKYTLTQMQRILQWGVTEGATVNGKSEEKAIFTYAEQIRGINKTNIFLIINQLDTLLDPDVTEIAKRPAALKAMLADEFNPLTASEVGSHLDLQQGFAGRLRAVVPGL